MLKYYFQLCCLLLATSYWLLDLAVGEILYCNKKILFPIVNVCVLIRIFACCFFGADLDLTANETSWCQHVERYVVARKSHGMNNK
jgi:hypothetical protein